METFENTGLIDDVDESMIPWLKSLRPHTEEDLEIARSEGYKQGKKDGLKEAWETAEEVSWKPTREQLDALFAAVYLKALRNTLEKDSVKNLENLLQQLKVLKGE